MYVPFHLKSRNKPSLWFGVFSLVFSSLLHIHVSCWWIVLQVQIRSTSIPGQWCKIPNLQMDVWFQEVMSSPRFRAPKQQAKRSNCAVASIHVHRFQVSGFLHWVFRWKKYGVVVLVFWEATDAVYMFKQNKRVHVKLVNGWFKWSMLCPPKWQTPPYRKWTCWTFAGKEWFKRCLFLRRSHIVLTNIFWFYCVKWWISICMWCLLYHVWDCAGILVRENVISMTSGSSERFDAHNSVRGCPN